MNTLVTKYVITYQLNISCCHGYNGTPYDCQGKLREFEGGREGGEKERRWEGERTAIL